MSDEQDLPPQAPIIPILLLIIIVLVGIVAYQAGVQQGGGGQGGKPQQNPNEPIPPTPAIEDDGPEAVALRSGEKIDRTTLRSRGVRLLDPNPLRGDNRDRLRKTVEEQKVYDSLLTWKMYGRVEDKKWGARAILNLSYGGEANLIRTVEKNDGEEIVVLYDFQSIKSIEILCDVESVKLDFMSKVTPGMGRAIGVASLWLSPIFNSIVPGSGTVLAVGGVAVPLGAQALLENLAKRGYQAAVSLFKNQDRMKVFGKIDSLEGKKVRVYHRGGAVEEIEPVGCDLTESERNFCANLGVLADYHIMPNLDVKLGESWRVRADNFSNMLDPSLRGIPSGALEITRRRSDEPGTATLEITAGTMELDSSDTKSLRLGKCQPRGNMTYDLNDGFVREATLKADMTVERMSKNHMLFETRFKSSPKLEIEYECSKGTEQVLRIPEEWKNLNLKPVGMENLIP